MPALRDVLLLLPLLMAAAGPVAVGEVIKDCGIAVYWGRNGDEGSLQDTCDTGNYAYVIIASLNEIGSNRPPNLNLTGHCNDAPAGQCAFLSSQIKHCQDKDIKVLLSLGGAVGDYGLASDSDARAIAAYLWEAYLGGESPVVHRPLGDAVLDGIDLDIQGGGSSNLYWDYLVRFLNGYSTAERKVYLSAAPQCPYPDYYMGAAIATGLLDYVWVQFYNNYCEYRDNDPSDLLRSWDQWATSIKAGKLLIGLLAANGTGSGYMTPEQLTSEVLPFLKAYPIYGGIMLWNRYSDGMSKFSDKVKPYVCTYSPQLMSQVALL